MSNTGDDANDFRGTNDQWSGIETDYPAGMILENNIFPPSHDVQVWGPENPLDVVGRKFTVLTTLYAVPC